MKASGRRSGRSCHDAYLEADRADRHDGGRRAVGSGTALAHNQGGCQFAEGRRGIHGHACVEQWENKYRASAHDKRSDGQQVYIEWGAVKNGNWDYMKRHDGSFPAAAYTVDRGEVVKFRICQSRPDGGEANDPCLPWRSL